MCCGEPESRPPQPHPFDIGRALGEVDVAFSASEHEFFSLLVDALNSLFESRFQALKLIGSRARGTAREDSDYDFLVFLASCDFDIDVPKLASLAAELEVQVSLGPLSLSPLSAEQFSSLDTKYPGITDNFRRDAIALWP